LKSIHFFADQDWFFVKNIPLNVMEMTIVFVGVYFLKSVLVRRSYTSFLKFSMILLLFFVVRIFTNWYYFEKNEVILAKYFNQKIFLVKNKGKVIFWV
jgi:competence protein ComEC